MHDETVVLIHDDTARRKPQHLAVDLHKRILLLTGEVPEDELLLQARGVTKTFGGLIAVDSVDFDIPRGSIVSLIGPNGAGKTTFFNMLTGFYVPTRGEISFDGRTMVTQRGRRMKFRKPHEHK